MARFDCELANLTAAIAVTGRSRRWSREDDTRSFFGLATLGGVLHRVFGVTMSQAELDEYNAYSDYLNAEIAAGRDPFDGEPATAKEWERAIQAVITVSLEARRG